jgi:hypothetical protein
MNLESLTAKYPSERPAMTRLAQLISTGEHKEYTLNRLCDLVEPKSIENLAGALGELVRSGEIKLVIRVISPSTQGGIAEFSSIDDVPAVVHDWRSDKDVEVRTDNLRVVYVTA